jgi:protein tyrosine phosphatase
MKLIKFIRAKLDKGENTIVHCTVGFGRTGTFIASVLTSKLKENVKFNLFKFIIKLREKRSEFVETDKQVEFIMKNMLATSLKGLGGRRERRARAASSVRKQRRRRFRKNKK